MRGAKTRLKRLVKTVEGKKVVELSRHYFSSILEIKGRLEMGRRLLKLAGSEPGFFRIVETDAVLKSEGTILEESEE